MISRYQTAAMRHLWSDEAKYETWYAVEVAYLEAYLAHVGKIDQPLIDRLRTRAQTIDWASFAKTVERYDAEVHHDVIAFLHALEDEIGDDARLIHLGLTSSDIVDTAFARTLETAGTRIAEQLKSLIAALWLKAEQNRGIASLGRTHGQAAEPTTFGIKLLSHLCELVRGSRRLGTAITDIGVGKFSGAVGVYSHTHPDVEKLALAKLGLVPETVATQVVARDRHAAFFAALATLAGSVERLAVEIRLLMHGQVLEVFEPFHAKQKGSSAMPHKKNPILSENLTGLMRLVRSYAMAAFENQALWHERDISHSSVERVIAPDATSVMEFALLRLTGLVKDLVIDRQRMSENLAASGELLGSQGVMLALVEKGMQRQRAYEIVQGAAIRGEGGSFKSRLMDAGITDYLNEGDLQKILSGSISVRFESKLFEKAKALMADLGK